MASSSNRALAAVVTAFALAVTHVVEHAEAHPNCSGDFAPDLDVSSSFCPSDNVDGFCCNAAQEESIETNYNLAGVSGRCAEMYQEVICGICHPWSGHLFERLGTAMTLTNDFCDEFYSECSAQLGLPSTYCDFHTGPQDGDAFYAYPYVPDDSFSGEGLVKAFPDIDDDDLPSIPIDMRMTPDGSKWWVLGLEGQIAEVDAANPTGTTLILDIADKIRLTFEEGLLSVAFSPAFHSTGVFYVSYVMTEDGEQYGSNRLSKFEYAAGDPAATSASEVVLITSVPKAFEVHSAGWIAFKPSAYSSSSASATHELYWAMGDAGPQLDTANNGQNTNTLHGSIIRIVVDSQMGSSYSVPGSNPFSGGGGKAEICAQGFRNPYKCSFDRENDDLYCGDVGQYAVETIKKIECGNNYGWRPLEGDRCLAEIEDDGIVAPYCDGFDRSPFTSPIFNYCHSDYYPVDEPAYLVPDDNFCGDRSIIGNAVIGGYVYRGVKYADLLYGNYVFADYQYSRLYNLYPNGNGGWGSGVIKNDDFFRSSSMAEDNDGELYLIAYKASIYELPCGDICDGENVNPVTQEPAPVPATPSPVTAPPTPAETLAPTAAPVADPTPAPTVAPTAVPETPSPTVAPTMMPVTLAPLATGETSAPSTASPTKAPVMATPAPTEAEVVTLSPTMEATASPTPAPVMAAETPAPSMKPEPFTLAPIMIRTAAPTATPEPTAPRTASPERVDDDFVPAPVRTATLPPVELVPTTPAPVVPVPVAPEDPEPAPAAVPEPSAGPVAPTMPIMPAPAPTAAFVCDGVPSPLGQYCCAAGCGECGGVGCSQRPGGKAACCTTKIKEDGYLCKETGAAPCRILEEDLPVPAPAPTAEAPTAPSTPAGPEPDTAPLIPGTPGAAVPPVSPEDFLKCGMDYGEDVVPMTGPEEGPVSPPEYLGCFVDDPQDRILALAYTASDDMTPTVCAAFCRDVGGDMFGVQHGRQCFCGDSRDTDIEIHGRTECNAPCSGDASVTCGGHDRFDGYYIGGGPQVPEGSVYVGCYSDNQRERALDSGFLWCDGTMTVPLCEQFCRSRDAVMYGLQYGHECWCGDHMNFDQFGAGKCNYRCVGDQHTTCGGYTAQNVYTLHY